MEPRYNNLGAIAELTGPTWAAPHFKQYEADLPRPAAKPYYDLDIPGMPPCAAALLSGGSQCRPHSHRWLLAAVCLQLATCVLHPFSASAEP